MNPIPEKTAAVDEKNWWKTIFNNQHTANRINTLLIALMMACLGGTIAQLGARIDPMWNGGYLILICFLISLEAVLTHHISHAFYTREKIGFRIAEWVGFIFLLKLLPYLANGFATFTADIQSWQSNLVIFFTPEYLGLLALSVLVWRVSGDFAEDFEILNAEITDIAYDEGKLDNSRGEARQHIVDRALILGVLVAFITVGTRLQMDVLWGERPLGATTLLYLLAYFVLTLALLGQTQFAMLRGQWLWHKITLSEGLAKDWIRYAAFFLLALTLIVLLMPTTYTLGFLESLQTVLNFLWSALVGLFTLLLLPFRWLLSLFTNDNSIIDQAPQPSETDTIPQPLAEAALPWLEVLKSILFWVIVIGLLGYTLWFYLRRTPQIGRFLARLRLTSWLKSLGAWLQARLGNVTQKASQALRSIRLSLRLRQPGTPTQTTPHFNFKQASPRQQVIYFYLQLLDKAAARGLERKPAQTPAQFEQTLASTLQDVEPEVRAMTDAFSEARYSRHPIEAGQTSLVRRMWNRIMQAFRRVPKKS